MKPKEEMVFHLINKLGSILVFADILSITMTISYTFSIKI